MFVLKRLPYLVRFIIYAFVDFYMLGLNISLLLLLVFLSSVFSSSETAIFSLSQIKVRKLLKQKKRGAITLMFLKENSDKTLITILIANNLVNIAASSLATLVAVDASTPLNSAMLLLLVASLLLLIPTVRRRRR